MRATYVRGSVEERFWAKVDVRGPDECWPWTAYCTPHGYGRFQTGSGPARAHRVAYELTHGPIPDGHFACHHCDNPPCCNPAHLFLGTQQDNIDDAISKGRMHPPPSLRGAAHPHARLTPDLVRSIRARAREGETQTAIAAGLDISRATVGAVVAGRNWGWVQ